MAETLLSGEEICGSRCKLDPEEGEGGAVVKEEEQGGFRAEVDTSAPFESVKEAVSRFGGLGFWKPNPNKIFEAQQLHEGKEIDIAKVEEQAAELEKELIMKEKDTLDVLKELEATKTIVEELKSKLQREEFSSQPNVDVNPNCKEATLIEDVHEGNNPNVGETCQEVAANLSSCPSSAPGLILLELKQAKLNLSRTTNNLAEIRASVESYNRKIEKERIALEKTRERLTSSTSKIASLEEELNRTRSKLQLVKDTVAKDGSRDISAEIQRLTSEAEQCKRMGEAAKSEVIRVMSEIEQTKTKIRTAEIRMVAAKKMKGAARAAEAVALAEIKAIEKSVISISSEASEQNSDAVTLTFEEYTSLASTARDAEEASKIKVIDAMLQVDEASLSQLDILKRVEETMEEIKISKKALEEALSRVEAATTAKLAVEEALRKWRSDHEQKRRSVYGSTKFKNSCPSHNRRVSRMLDVNGVNLINDASAAPTLTPTLSIGQILSRKLLVTEEFEGGKNSVKRKVSLGQMLGRQNGGDLLSSSSWRLERENGSKKFPAKRKKFGFARFSLLLAKQDKKKKKPTPVSRGIRC